MPVKTDSIVAQALYHRHSINKVSKTSHALSYQITKYCCNSHRERSTDFRHVTIIVCYIFTAKIVFVTLQIPQ